MAAAAPSQIETLLSEIRQGVPVLTPTLRLARALRGALTRAMANESGVLETPSVQVYGAWLEARWLNLVEQGLTAGGRVLTGLEAEAVWLEIIEHELQHSTDFSLISAQAAAQSAHQCRESLRQYMAPGDIHGRFAQDPDCLRFYGWMQRFEARLREQGWLTAADMEVAVAETVKRDHERIVFVRGAPMTPAALAALDAACDRVDWLQPPAAIIQPTSLKFPDPHCERRAAAHWAAERQKARPGTSAIVLLNMGEQRRPMELALREAFNRLDARYDSLPVNFSQGVSYADTPMYRDALLALGVLTGAVSRSDVLAIARSPYLQPFAGLGEPQLLSWIRDVMALGVDPIPPQTLLDSLTRYSDSTIAKLLRQSMTTRLPRIKQRGHEWRPVMLETLQAWQWPRRADMDSFEYQLVERFEQVLDDFEQLASISAEMGFHEALGALRKVLERRQFQPRTEDDAIQVLSDKEVRGLKFESVWVLGAQSGILPRKAELLPFVPARLQRELSMPVGIDPEGVHAATDWLAGLGALSDEVILSCHAEADGVEQLPSPLIPEPRLVTDLPVPVTHRWQASQLGDVATEVVEDQYAQPLVLDGKSIQGGSGLLRDQSQCPFRGWARHRLQLKPLGEVAQGLTPLEKGELIHDGLAAVMAEIGNSQRLHALDQASLGEIIDKCTSAAIGRLSLAVRRRVGGNCLDVESRHLRDLLTRWLEVEKQRDKHFEVIASEESHVLKLAGLELELRVDRIDALEDGRHLVIDYKAGSQFSRSAWWGERIKEPQLPSYALLDDRAEGVSWATLGGKQPGFVPLGESLGVGEKGALADQLRDEDVISWAVLRDSWRQQLEQVMTGFVAGDATVDPMPGACQYCAYETVCRIGQEIDVGEQSL